MLAFFTRPLVLLAPVAFSIPALAQPNILPGHYIGSWTNTTFSSTGGLKGDVIVRNGLLTLILDVDGSVFGDPNPIPLIRGAVLTPSGASYAEIGHPTFGDFSVQINNVGGINISATNVPSAFVSSYTSSGSISGGSISGTGVVHLSGGGTANGIASASRTAFSALFSDNQVLSGHFGAAVAGIADVDGDGRGDIIVGAPGERPDNLVSAGRAYIISGASGNIIRTLISPGREANGYFGASVAAVPDANGDGIPDVVVGAPGEDPGTNPVDTGRAYLYSGATGALLFKLIPPTPSANMSFGFAVAGIPDVNGDGRGDVAVGAPFETYAGSPANAGRVYIYSGATGQRLRTITPPTPTAFDFFGFSVAGLADITGDNRGDVIVGAPESDDTHITSRPGHVYFFSGATGQFVRMIQSPGAIGDGRFGFSVAGVPDTNGDGRPDIVVGSPNEHPGASPFQCGRANLYSGLTGQLLFKLLPPTPNTNGRFGRAVAGIPDLSGDNRGDIIVGASGEPQGGGGRIHIYNGATGARIATHASIYPDNNGLFGAAVGGVPDLSGNGRGDVVVGASDENPVTAPTPPTDAGRAYIIRK